MQRTETPEAVSDAEERITQLEDRVQGAAFGNGRAGGGRGGQRRTEGRRTAAAGAGKNTTTGRNTGNRHRGQEQQDHHRGTTVIRTPGRGRIQDDVTLPAGETSPQRLVLDTSSLLFSLLTIKRLLHPPSSSKHQAHSSKPSAATATSTTVDGAELIVPLETLRTLDLLKKGTHPYAQAARAATRFIELEQRRTRDRVRAEAAEVDDAGQHRIGNKVTAEHEVGDDGWRKVRPGLWVQQEQERMDVFPSSDPQSEQTQLEQIHQQEEDPPFPAPVAGYITETLACALYFREWWDVPSSQAVLGIAHPCPGAANTGDDPVARAGAGEGEGRRKDDADAGAQAVELFGERAEGFAIREWAERGDVAFLDFTPPAQRSSRNQDTAHTTYAHTGDVLDGGDEENVVVPLLEEEVAVVRLTSEEDDPRAEVLLPNGRERNRGKQQPRREEGQRNRRRAHHSPTMETYEPMPAPAITSHTQSSTVGTKETQAPVAAATPTLLTRVPQIFDAQRNGMVSSAEMKAQRDREAARYARQAHGHGGQGYGQGPGQAQGVVSGNGGGGARGGRNVGGAVNSRGLPSTATTPAGQAKSRGMTLLQRPATSSANTATLTQPKLGGTTGVQVRGGGEPSNTGSGTGERKNGKGRRGGDRPARALPSGTTRLEQPQQTREPQVMLLQRPK
ncbi:hypothetical protein QFC22_005046 [Naganishia vaughanmartiniae]|uniref:Uncharacterized protein n=1 Tax=Naganishia vaughanmartiniae TaxID=1424756 RepID=A0ACC2WWL6_9TREE|nr:hypothetical protein QFC22_005046 [Naganishia vaughanmartiniae]